MIEEPVYASLNLDSGLNVTSWIKAIFKKSIYFIKRCLENWESRKGIWLSTS